MFHRYQQQMILPEIGITGQQLLKEAKVLVVGAGGLGNPAATYLGAMGVGHIGIIDQDTVQATNLHRQFQFIPNNIGKQKADILATQIQAQNESILVNAINQKIEPHNAAQIITMYNIVCDCTDNAATRILINQTCALQKKSLVYGAVKEWIGYLTILHGKASISLNDIFDDDALLKSQENNCSAVGINSAVCGIVGAYMASEVVKLIVNHPSNLDGHILCIDTLNNTCKTYHLQR